MNELDPAGLEAAAKAMHADGRGLPGFAIRAGIRAYLAAAPVPPDDALIAELREDPDKWSFRALVRIAQLMLDTTYPDDVFGSGPLSLDAGARFTAKLREALRCVDAEPAPVPPDGEPRLCFVAGSFAWFTERFDDVRGDDWNDAPHDCNAGTPYAEFGPFTVVAFDGFAEAVDRWPDPRHGPYISADDCNAGRAPWLIQPGYGTTYPEPEATISGGVTIAEFTAFIEAGEGSVYHAFAAGRAAATPDERLREAPDGATPTFCSRPDCGLRATGIAPDPNGVRWRPYCSDCLPAPPPPNDGWVPGCDDPEPRELGNIDTGEGWYET